MMNEFGYWMFESVICGLVGFEVYGFDIILFVNIFLMQFYDIKLVFMLKCLIYWYGVNMKQLELELIEDIVVFNFLMVKKQLVELCQFGIQVVVDDFGKGYLNLVYICDFEFNILKIDKIFVMEFIDNLVNKVIIEVVWIIGQVKECEVIVEGVEIIE